MIILFSISIVYYNIIDNSIDRGLLISNFQSHVFYDPIRSKILGIDRGHNLYFAIYNEYIPSTIMAKQNITIVQYIEQQFQKELDGLYNLKAGMITKSRFLPEYYIDYLTQNKVSQKLIVGLNVQMPFPSLLATTFDRNIVAKHYTPQEWKTRKSDHANLVNFTLFQFQQTILKPIIRALITQNSYQDNLIMKILISLETILIIGICITIFLVYKLIQIKTKYISLLTKISNKHLRQKQNANQQIFMLLQIIMKSSLNSLILNENTETISFKYGINKIPFDKTMMNVEQIKSSSIRRGYQLKNTKQLDRSNYLFIEYLIILIGIFLLVIIGVIFSLGYFKITKNALKSFGYFQQYVQIDVIGAQSVAYLLNTNIMAISRNTFNIAMTPPQQLFKRSHHALINRSLETKLRYFYPHISYSTSSNEEIQDYLYQNKCNASDQLCKNILSGSMTRGIPSALLSYITLSNKLYSQNYNSTGPYSLSSLKQLTQLLVFYCQYLRGSMSMINFILSKVEQILSYEKNQTQTLLKFTLIMQFILLIFLSIYIFYQKNHIFNLKKQTLSILPIDILLENIDYNFQINNLQ